MTNQLDKSFEALAITAANWTLGSPFTTGFSTNTTAYAQNDVLGGLLYFDMRKSNTGSVLIVGATVTDNDTKGVAGDLYLFNALPTAIADNAAFAGTLVLADWLARQTKISFATYDVDSAFETCEINGISRLCVVNTGFLYGYFKITTASPPTFANGKAFNIKLACLTQ